MSRDRIEIEKVENGYEIIVYKKSEDDDDNDFGYVEPKKFVATDKKAAMKIFEENFS